MGYSVFPAPATGPTLQQIKDGLLDNWTLISSVTPTNGSTTVSFTGLSGYRKYWVVVNDIACNTGSFIGFRINNNGGGVYRHWYQRSDGNSYFTAGTEILLNAGTGTNGIHGNLIVENANLSIVKRYEYRGWANAAGTVIDKGDGQMIDTSAVTSLQVFNQSGNTFTATGTVYLYGVAV